jgi:hypothetical protein
MYDAVITIRQGESLPEYATLTASGTDTLTLSAATFQLLNADHTSVDNSEEGGTDFSSPVDATGFDPAEATSNRAWYVLAAADTLLLIAGSYYIGRFVLTETGSDGIDRINIVEIQVVVVW